MAGADGLEHVAPAFLGEPAISVSSDGRWMLRQRESDLMVVETFR
jgi:hypothetical protein